MTIIDALTNSNFDLRITNSNKWLFWDKRWIVCIKEYRKKNTKILIETDNESEAINILLKD